MAGVPLWQLGPESRHPGVPYIVFPGDLSSQLLYFVAQFFKSWMHDWRPIKLSFLR